MRRLNFTIYSQRMGCLIVTTGELRIAT
jgi:hypothetical protein